MNVSGLGELSWKTDVFGVLGEFRSEFRSASPMQGGLTHQWEQDILHALQRRGVRLSPEHVAGKFSGYTEAWIQEDFPAKSLAELMQLVHDDEGSNNSNNS